MRFFKKKNKDDLRYNFGECDSDVKTYLTRLRQDSKNFFSSLVQDGKILQGQAFSSNPSYINEFNKTMTFVNCVEDYLYYYFIHDRNNFQNVFNGISKLKGISVLDDNQWNVYGVTNNNDTIQINPNLSGNDYLTPEQRTRLYVCHELGHMVNSKWMRKTTNFLSSDNKLDKRQKQLFYDGFSLIDEATTQDRAEDIAYFFARKNRPKATRYIDNKGMYNQTPYSSNFDYYCELQEPAICFARTLRGIGKIRDDEQVMKVLSKRALNPSFSEDVISEYINDGQLVNLYNEFQFLGYLKNASYARFGYASKTYLNRSGQIFTLLKDLTTKLRDYRDPSDFER